MIALNENSNNAKTN
jgi:hypothetical protein